jgi:hypothetical protein
VDVPSGFAINPYVGSGGAGDGVDLERVAGLIDLSLLRSGRDFSKVDLVTLARWVISAIRSCLGSGLTGCDRGPRVFGPHAAGNCHLRLLPALSIL